MRVIAKRTLRQFWEKHPDAERPLRDWYALAARADWMTPAAVKRQFGNVSFIAGNRAVFNIGGNRFRLVAKLRYDKQILFVRFIGTHGDYDLIDARNV